MVEAPVEEEVIHEDNEWGISLVNDDEDDAGGSGGGQQQGGELVEGVHVSTLRDIWICPIMN